MWRLLAELLDPEKLETIRAATIGLEELNEYAPRIIEGRVGGRVVVDVASALAWARGK